MEYSGAHILVAYRTAATIRTKQEALTTARQLAESAQSDPSRFARLAAEHSDDPSSARRGGSLGIWSRGSMPAAIDRTIQKLRVGEISEPVETGLGYHVILRTAPRLTAAHVLVAFKGAAQANVDRTKEEALARATKVSNTARLDPDRFAELAMQFSDDPASRSKGGSLGKWRRGRLQPDFEQAVDTLAIGEVSQPVLTRFGYHVIIRRDPEDPGDVE